MWEFILAIAVCIFLAKKMGKNDKHDWKYYAKRNGFMPKNKK